MATIHPTAVVHPKAEVRANCEIGPYCLIGEHVVLGEDCRLHSHVVIDGHTRLGRELLMTGANPNAAELSGIPTRARETADSSSPLRSGRNDNLCHQGVREMQVRRDGRCCWWSACV